MKTKLSAALIVIAALFAVQAQAQELPLTGTELAAYNSLLSGLEAGTGTESADESLVQAARDAGLPENAIAGALAESGRSSEQQAAALIPPNATTEQANTAQYAMINATNSQGTNIATATAATVTAAIRPAVPPGVTIPIAPPQPNPVGGLAGANNVNTLPATATGQSGSLPPALNSLTNTIAQSSGPAITETAVAQNIPTIPVEDVDFQTEPEPEIPEARPIHVF